MPLLGSGAGFSLGSSGDGALGKSLDDMIADRRKEQAKAATGRKDAGKAGARNAKTKDKKEAITDRSIATGRAKRAAAARARRGLSNDKKPSAMEVEKEVYRQARKTAASKKRAEKKATNGRLPANSSLRDKKAAKPKTVQKPKQKQIKAALQGMELAGCPMPQGFQLVMQFTPMVVEEKAKGKKPNANNNKANNKTNNNQKNTGGRKGGRGQKK